MKRIASLLAIALVISLVLVGCGPKITGPAFYEGKTMTLIVSTNPGGGYDTWGRLVAQYMQKYLPGSTIIVENKPGAGHIIGCNAIYSSAPDGLTFGTFNRALPLAQISGLEGVSFDLAKMSWLGSPCTEPYSLIVSTKPGWKTLDDMIKAEKVIMGSAGVGSEAHVTALLFIEMMGLKNWKVVPGYSGGEGELAMMRGEIHAQFASFSSLERFVKDGNGIPVMFNTLEPMAGYESVPLLPNVVKDKKYEPVVGLLMAIGNIGRPFAGPPNIPADRLKILREAFDKACADPEFITKGVQIGRPVELVNGETAQSMVAGLLQLSPDVVSIIKAAYTPAPTPTPTPGAGKVYAIGRISIEDTVIELRMGADSYWGYAASASIKDSWTMTVKEGDTIKTDRLASSSSRSTKAHAFTIKGLNIDVPLNVGDKIEPYEIKIPAGSAGTTYEITSSKDPGLFEGKYKIVVEK